jgi:hypothetical protein
MAYSSVIEPVGIRDLAKDDPGEYRNRVQDFLDQIKRSLRSDMEKISIYFMNDYAFIQTENLDTLLDFLTKIRNRLINKNMVIRGALTEGDLQAEKIEEDLFSNLHSIMGYEFGPLATELAGMQDGLKGLGIKITKKVARERKKNEDKYYDLLTKKDKTKTLTAKEKAFLKSNKAICDLPNFFYNYHITDSKVRRYDGYYDLALDNDYLTPANLSKIIKLFRQSRVSSKKLARFFIPLLVNWTKHMDLSPDEESNNPDSQPSTGSPTETDATEESFYDLDILISKGKLTGLREIIGLELIFLSLMDRVFGSNSELGKYDKDRIDRLRTYYKSIRKWVQKYIRSDNQPVLIPKNILTPRSKRRFAKYLETV